MKIEWSSLAEDQLKDIYSYYSLKASPKVARNIISKIIEKVDILLNNPFLGAKEELLSQYPQDFRFLVVDSYKLIYWIEENSIIIASVFDCRQNPVKIKNLTR